MKTKVLKFGMPVMAFLLAIVFAFATTPETVVEESTLVPGYILQNGKCIPVTTCSTTPGPVCMYSGVIARTKVNNNECGSFLYHWSN